MPDASPFDTTGIERDDVGRARYVDRPDSLVHMLRATVDRVPDAEAVAEVGGRRVSYAELWDAAATAAGGLLEQGVVRGDRVGLRTANGLDWCIAFFATQLAGAVAVPVNSALTETETRYLLEDSGTRYCFEPGAALPAGTPHACEDLRPEELAAIFYTSGTTGRPKGAMTTHANFLANTETVRRIVDFPRDAQGVRDLATAPLFSVTACNSQLLPMCESGGTTVVLPQFTPAAFAGAIGAERATLLIASPGMYRLALAHPSFAEADTRTVTRAVYGAAPATPQFLDQMAGAFPSAEVEIAFGLTEVSSVATYLPGRFARDHADSVGFAAPVVDLRLDNEDAGTGVGELLVRGPNVVAGYWNKPVETAETFVDGWLHTGDLARLQDGLTYIVDRMKDMILRGGENVYCVEVENALLQHPDVLEAAVVGVPDDLLGERVGAVLVPVPGRAFDPAAVLADAAQSLARYKLPQWVSVRSTPMPRNPGGKIVKPVLRETTRWERVR